MKNVKLVIGMGLACASLFAVAGCAGGTSSVESSTSSVESGTSYVESSTSSVESSVTGVKDNTSSVESDTSSAESSAEEVEFLKIRYRITGASVNNLALEPGENRTLKVECNTSSVTGSDIHLVSSNANIVGGYVTNDGELSLYLQAKSTGEAEIYLLASNGVRSDTHSVTVKSPCTIKSISWSDKNGNLLSDNSETLNIGSHALSLTKYAVVSYSGDIDYDYLTNNLHCACNGISSRVYIEKELSENKCLVSFEVNTYSASDKEFYLYSSDESVQSSKSRITFVQDYSVYKSYTYKELARDPDKYEGKPIVIRGKVIQVTEDYFDNNDITLRVEMTYEPFEYLEGGIYSDPVYVTYTRKSSSESRILEDDIIQLYGVCKGLKTYTSVLGSSVTIPQIEADEIFIVGTDD